MKTLKEHFDRISAVRDTQRFAEAAPEYRKLVVRDLERWKQLADENGYDVQERDDGNFQAWRDGKFQPIITGFWFQGNDEYPAEYWMRVPKKSSPERELNEDDDWYKMIDDAMNMIIRDGKSIDDVVKYMIDTDRLGQLEIGSFVKELRGEKWNESKEIGEMNKGPAPGWMLRQDPELGKKVKDQTRGYKELKKFAGKDIPKK